MPSTRAVGVDSGADNPSANGRAIVRHDVPDETHTRACCTCARQVTKAREERPAFTPPRVEGISLAPVSDAVAAQASVAKDLSLTKRRWPQHLRVGVPPGQIIANMRYDGAKGDSPTREAANAALQLFAEGKSIHKGGPPGMNAEVNAMWLMYREINDADSLCATPPLLSLDLTRMSNDFNGPLGPLTPHPLSPSILTVCGALDGLEPPHGAAAYGEDPGPLWDLSDPLPDMRKGATLPTIQSA